MDVFTTMKALGKTEYLNQILARQRWESTNHVVNLTGKTVTIVGRKGTGLEGVLLAKVDNAHVESHINEQAFIEAYRAGSLAVTGNADYLRTYPFELPDAASIPEGIHTMVSEDRLVLVKRDQFLEALKFLPYLGSYGKHGPLSIGRLPNIIVVDEDDDVVETDTEIRTSVLLSYTVVG